MVRGHDESTQVGLARRLPRERAGQLMTEEMARIPPPVFAVALGPWAAALPQIRPNRRKGLLQSISEAAATAPGWSTRAPSFFPDYVEKEAA